MIFRGRDEQFVGVPPGQFPAEGQPVAVGKVRGGREWRGEVAVQFQPPKDVAPALAGTVIDGVVDARDLAAMMIDLSLRGWFTLKKQGDDWQLSLLRPIIAAELAPAEVLLLQGLFPGQVETVLLSQAKSTLGRPLRGCRDELYREVVHQGWYSRDPHRGRLARLVRGRVPRTASGTAVRIQTMGFHHYLRTAEASQIRFEEAADQFSRYLPYAMVFGIADRWAGVIGEVVRREQARDPVAVAAEFASDPVAWELLGGLVDLAGAGVEVVNLAGEVGGLLDLGTGLGGIGEAFEGLGDFLDGFDLFDLFDF